MARALCVEVRVRVFVRQAARRTARRPLHVARIFLHAFSPARPPASRRRRVPPRRHAPPRRAPGSLGAIEAAAAEDGLLFLVAQRSADTRGAGGRRPASRRRHGDGSSRRRARRTARRESSSRESLALASRATCRRPATCAPRSPTSRRPSRDDPANLNVVARRVLALFEEYVALHRRIPNEVVAARSGRGLGRAPGVRHRGSSRRARRDATDAARGADAPAAPRFARARCSASEIELLRLERKLDEEVRGSLFQNQREFYLQEQLKAIHRELGQDETDDVGELERLIEARKLPDAVRDARAARSAQAAPDVAALARVDRRAQFRRLDSRRCRGTSAPTTCSTSPHARRVLDEDHYGLEEVKDRILDYIGVLSLVDRMEGPILCLVGPPGVGKTSLGRSIARALGRKFVRMSLGGVRDEAEIRGHRRTYIGSMPGRVIQAMRRAEVVNPVILLDEIDKLGQDYRGDPSAALLEVLDPEQNRAFNDHYLEVDYDLSQVLFVTTANYLPQVPEPLRDRMEIIRLAGYLDQEKFAIARQFLVPKQLRLNGLESDHVEWDTDVIPSIVHSYTREAGVRELERRIGRIARKLARREAESRDLGSDRAIGGTRDAKDARARRRPQGSARHRAVRSGAAQPRPQGRRRHGARLHERRRRSARDRSQRHRADAASCSSPARSAT